VLCIIICRIGACTQMHNHAKRSPSSSSSSTATVGSPSVFLLCDTCRCYWLINISCLTIAIVTAAVTVDVNAAATGSCCCRHDCRHECQYDCRHDRQHDRQTRLSTRLTRPPTRPIQPSLLLMAVKTKRQRRKRLSE